MGAAFFSLNWVAPQLQQFKFNLFGGLLMGFGAVASGQLIAANQPRGFLRRLN